MNKQGLTEVAREAKRKFGTIFYMYEMSSQLGMTPSTRTTPRPNLG